MVIECSRNVRFFGNSANNSLLAEYQLVENPDKLKKEQVFTEILFGIIKQGSSQMYKSKYIFRNFLRLFLKVYVQTKREI